MKRTMIRLSLSPVRLLGRALLAMALTLGYVAIGLGLSGAFVYLGDRASYAKESYPFLDQVGLRSWKVSRFAWVRVTKK
jgi:hypothetical protein